MIEVESVSYSVGTKTIVDSVSLGVQKGELVAVIGPNGAGKSSMVGLIAGDLRPDSGAARVGGMDSQTTAPGQMARQRAVMPQQTAIRFPFTAHEVALMGRHPYLGKWRSPSARDFDVVEKAMRETEVWHLRDRIYNTLSGGEQRRTALARAFAQDTAAIVLDEPTSALDIGHQELVMSRCRAKADEGRAVLMVLHDLNVAAAYADRIAVMKDGRLAACGPPREVIRSGLIGEVFGHPVVVFDHPCSGCPVALPDTSRGRQSLLRGDRDLAETQPVG
jgi:iron complex transport system ATP-binding protein